MRRNRPDRRDLNSLNQYTTMNEKPRTMRIYANRLEKLNKQAGELEGVISRLSSRTHLWLVVRTEYKLLIGNPLTNDIYLPDSCIDTILKYLKEDLNRINTDREEILNIKLK